MDVNRSGQIHQSKKGEKFHDDPFTNQIETFQDNGEHLKLLSNRPEESQICAFP